ncbi:MAG: 3-hydroxybutyryl-CoA dehydrogenase [Armatimonadetes bacterium]|nr:3-hydroxybutyryl-CoA dehydrogenase [Armatimonadota bacterium]
MKVIAVIGTGTMGSGIAQIAAMSGYKTLLNDIEQSFVERAMSAVGKSLDKFVQKQTLAAEERDRVLARMSTATDLGALSEADLVIEAVTEKIEVKRELFGRLDKICPERTLFATNTSSLSVTEMARATARPERVVGMHFFNPPALMKLVEVVRTPLTSEAAFATVWEVAQKMGKVPVETRDTPGFIFNRLIIPYLNEAIWAVYEGVGKVDDIDRAMKLGGNMPIGPLALLDLIGIDVQLHACGAMHDELGDPKFRVCPLNRQMVRAGYLGRKSGKGFYDYGSEPPTPVDFSVFKF